MLLLLIATAVVGVSAAGLVVMVVGLAVTLCLLAALAVYLLLTVIFVVCIERPLARRRERRPIVAILGRIRREQTAHAPVSAHLEPLTEHGGMPQRKPQELLHGVG